MLKSKVPEMSTVLATTMPLMLICAPPPLPFAFRREFGMYTVPMLKLFVPLIVDVRVLVSQKVMPS